MTPQQESTLRFCDGLLSASEEAQRLEGAELMLGHLNFALEKLDFMGVGGRCEDHGFGSDGEKV